ncbi:MAG: Crp/Fnr family transcriptional regulator [Rhodospirillaceae bacterium]
MPPPQILERKIYPAGQVIFRQGDPGSCAYLLRKGRVDISCVEHDRIVHLTVVEAKQIFGEMSLIDGKPRSATATTIEACEVVIVNQSAIDRQMDSMEPFMRAWIRLLSGRVRDLNARLGEKSSF